MPKREKLPDDLKELCLLCRAGKLFAVQQWIRDSRRLRTPAGNFATSPIRTAIESGFHSMVEVLLQEGTVDQEEKNDAFIKAIDSRNFDLVELLTQYGADPWIVDFDTILCSRHPQIMRWFVANGLDLECDCYAEEFAVLVTKGARAPQLLRNRVHFLRAVKTALPI
ncbi:MAG: hypothetical protein DME99_06755 [Verrucomicrobia bacterium]|nr:MAG: hypothetical protein DME99_06755 [Verrucomicrobiota bacterium]